MLNLSWTPEGWEDYLYWQKTDKKTLKRINLLIKETLREPNSGIGKPEIMKHDFAGFCSRRINSEHRLVYETKNDNLIIHQCRYHYKKS